MKNMTILLLLFVSFILPVNDLLGQDTRPNTDLKSARDFGREMDQYLSKSKRQKTLAWIFLGGGIGLAAIAPSVHNNSIDQSAGSETLSAIGGIAEIASIPLFFSAAKNRDKAQLVFFEKNLNAAATEADKKVALEDAVEYFKSKSSNNRTAAIILSGVGAGFIIAGALVREHDSGNGWGEAYNDWVLRPVLILSGATLALLSIPFYVRAGSLNKKAQMILRTGRIPDPVLGFTPSVKTGRNYLALGIKIPL